MELGMTWFTPFIPLVIMDYGLTSIITEGYPIQRGEANPTLLA